MKFYFFHLMPYKYVSEEAIDEVGTAWVKLSNSVYDPEKGHELYNEYLDELEYAEELGFDGVCVNEHHSTAYGSMPSPNILASMLARRTKKVEIAILGSALPLRNYPLRVAEEIAILDVVTKGRIISGFVRGIGSEYFVFGLNPNDSRDRFMEAHDLIVKAWTEAGPFSFEGKHYNLDYVNPWPRPYQQPHPPIWIPSSGSTETIEWASQKKYTYLQTFSDYQYVKRNMLYYHQVAKEKWGYDASPYQLGWAMPIYVAETDEQAIEEASEAIEFFYNKLIKRPAMHTYPPGYISEQSEKKILAAKGNLTTTKHTARSLMERGQILFGSPETVANKLIEYQREINLGNYICMLQFGNLSHEKTMKNAKMFAERVMPVVKEKVGQLVTN